LVVKALEEEESTESTEDYIVSAEEAEESAEEFLEAAALLIEDS
jgi:hypothetical protein